MEYFTDELKEHGEEEHDKEDDNFPSVTGSHLTYSLYRRTAYVTRICAHVTNTAAVTVFLDKVNHQRHYRDSQHSYLHNRPVANVQSDDLWPSRMHAATLILQEKTCMWPTEKT